ncbi:MAG TPA: S41 family peptidase [Symbiobacteriaceae bacterium]|nr:S41 family peptidase [Symbiobacteriaceae bacterium]
MMERRKALALMVVLVVLSSSLSFYAGAADLVPRLSRYISYGGGEVAPRSSSPAEQNGVDQVQIQRIQQYIQDKFLFPVSAEKLTEGALKGMVAATEDKYSAYYNPKEFEEFKNHFKGTFSGIGVHVEQSPKTGLVTVVRPIKGSPGEKAGMQAGDAIVEVDGKDIRGYKLEDAVQLIKGPEGTKVKLTVMREGVADPLSFEITRATIEYEYTSHRMIDSEVGYLQLTEFTEDVNVRVGSAIADMKAQGMTRLILDLRQNPGGLLDEAVAVSSYFVPTKTPIVFVESKGAPRETHVSRNMKDKWTGPLVVLVDENSASASEITAGAIKDLKVGVLVGTKTFGKGIVQTFYNLPGGAGIKLTTARYLTAGGNSIHEKGIEPDVKVENPNKVLPGDPGDVQLEQAVQYIKGMKR